MGVFVMPSLGSDMEDGTLVEWLVKPGDTVHRGDVIAVVETQKGAIEIEIFEDGTVQSLTADIGATLPVGAALATIGDSMPEAAPAKAAAPAKPSTAPKPPAAASPPPAPKASPAVAEPIPPVPTAPVPAPQGPDFSATPSVAAASPAARALAGERGIDLASITGTGPGGAIVRADVEAAGAVAVATPKRTSTGMNIEAMRAAISTAMTRAKREIPHYYLTHEIDLQTATDWLTRRNAALGPADRLLMGALLVKATALAAKSAKAMNGRYEAGVFAPSETVNTGVAVALRGGGLVAPAMTSTETMTLDQVMAAMRDLVARARAGRLRSSEMTSGTITISSLGERGVDTMTGVIYPPQVALVGFGTPRPAARVVGGKVEPRQAVTVSLAADHRVSDGRLGARMLSDIDRLLQSPEAL